VVTSEAMAREVMAREVMASEVMASEVMAEHLSIISRGSDTTLESILKDQCKVQGELTVKQVLRSNHEPTKFLLAKLFRADQDLA